MHESCIHNIIIWNTICGKICEWNKNVELKIPFFKLQITKRKREKEFYFKNRKVIKYLNYMQIIYNFSFIYKNIMDVLYTHNS